MKQTAVEWLISKIERSENPSLTQKEVIEYVNQAKEMEKQQSYSEDDLEEAFKSGFTNCYNHNNTTFGEWFEQFEKK